MSKRRARIAEIPEHFGIIDTPSDPDNMIEIHHHDPSMISSITDIFVTMGVTNIYFIFDVDRFSLAGFGTSKSACLVATIRGSDLTKYYCRGHYTIVISAEDNAHILQRECKLANSISIIHNCPDILTIAMRHDIIALNTINDMHRLIIQNQEELSAIMYFNNDPRIYDLSFSIPSPALKRITTITTKRISSLRLEKTSDSHLMYSYQCENNGVSTKAYFGDDKIINIMHRSNITHNIVKIRHIHEFSGKLDKDCIVHIDITTNIPIRMKTIIYTSTNSMINLTYFCTYKGRLYEYVDTSLNLLSMHPVSPIKPKVEEDDDYDNILYDDSSDGMSDDEECLSV
jgi:hypothetical protein